MITTAIGNRAIGHDEDPGRGSGPVHRESLRRVDLLVIGSRKAQAATHFDGLASIDSVDEVLSQTRVKTLRDPGVDLVVFLELDHEGMVGTPPDTADKLGALHNVLWHECMVSLTVFHPAQ